MDPVDNDNDGNGDNLRRLTKNPRDDQSPAWSPDGRKIAFMSYRNGDWQIFAMNKDGSKQKNRTRVGEGSQYPDWGKRP